MAQLNIVPNMFGGDNRGNLRRDDLFELFTAGEIKEINAAIAGATNDKELTERIPWEIEWPDGHVMNVRIYVQRATHPLVRVVFGKPELKYISDNYSIGDTLILTPAAPRRLKVTQVLHAMKKPA